MYNRYPAEPRANPRDRSPPPRVADRRPSVSYPSQGQPPSRPLDDANSPPLGREPPRGPKALASFAPTGPRGRGGYAPRGDYRDRDRDRDFRDAPVHRRDSDRERPRWPDRDFDRERGSYRGGRSRSPPVRDFTHAREATRRDSIGGLLAPGFDSSAGGFALQSRGGGSIRGRGRPEWDRGRGRGLVFEDREAFRRRSRSREREGWREREISRDRDRDRDGEYRDRREDDKKAEREERERESLSWKRPSSRNDSRNPSGSTNPSTPLPLSAHSSHPPSTERPTAKDAFDTARRVSTSITPSGTPRENRRDGDKTDYFSSRTDAPRFQQRTSSPPPSGPQVPAFGSLPILNPASVAVSTAAKPSLVSGAISKSESREDVPLTVVRPPTAPKAQREAAQQLDQRDPNVTQTGPWGRQDGMLRASQLSRPPASKAPESAPTGPAASMVGREQDAAGQTELINYGATLANRAVAPLSASTNTPFGKPQSGFGAALSPTPQTSTIPRPSMLNSNASSGSNFPQSIPTGPRQNRPSRPIMAGGIKTNQWVNPGYRKPSLMASMMPKAYYGEERETSKSDPFATSPVGKAQHQPERRLTLLPAKHEQQEDLSGAGADGSKARDTSNELESKHADGDRIPESLGQSSEEEDEEEDGLGLDEDDVERAERSYQKQREALAAKKPPMPLKDPIVVGLLLRIQLLGMIANDDIPEGLREAPVPEEEEPQPLPAIPPTGLPSPSAEEDQPKAPEPQRRPLKEAPVHKPLTPPPDSLMFIKSAPVTPISEMDVLEESLDVHDRIKDALLSRLAEQREEILEMEDDLRDEWEDHCRRYRAHVEMIDRIKREENPTPAPATPPPSLATAPTATPIIEVGRRAGIANKFTTELDFQNILKASEQSAREEQERRDRQESAKPDYEKEAIIPDMLNDYDREAWIFQDTNHLVPQDKVLEVFEFVPPRDDFTVEEERVFLEQFLTYPKKWGKIAEAIPDRDFQQCIQHYYLTKAEHEYKIKLQKRWAKRGRRIKGTTTTAKSQALMADLGARNPDLYDGGEFAPAVTDTGRPRRAAAPTFGESGPETENSTPAPSLSRRAAKEQNGEPAIEKPTRGRRTGPGSRGGRRAKVPQQQQALAVAPGPSPQKTVRELTMSAPKEELRPQEQWEPKVHEDQRQAYASEQDPWRDHATDYSFSRPSESDASSMARPQAAQPSSYWSVPEQRAFPALVNHFGTDFEAIATFMGTKTTIMVKNHYQRCVGNKEKKTISGVVVGTELEAIALEAEARAKRGEPPGPLPEQPVAPKRRYDTTSTPLVQRPLAPSVEPVDMEEAAATSLVKPVQGQQTSPPPVTALSRSTLVDATQKQRYPPLGLRANEQQSPPQRQGEEQLRTIRPQVAQQQRHGSGPKMGYFTDGPAESRPTSQPSPAVPRAAEQMLQQQPVTQHPAHHHEVARHEQVLQEQQNLAQQRLGGPIVEAKPVQAQYHHSPPFGPQQHYSSQQATGHQPSAPFSHSRHSSSNMPVAPGQPTLKQEPDLQSLRHIDPYPAQKQYAPSPRQSPIMSRPAGLFSPRKEAVALTAAPMATAPPQAPAPAPEPPRAAPAKRSNIMNILNDDPPEPAPKRVSSDQATASDRTSYASSPPHQMYHPMRHTQEQQHQVPRREEASSPHRLYHQPQHVQQQQQPQHYPPLRREEGSGGFADSHISRPRSLYGDPAMSQESNNQFDRLREQGQTPRLEASQTPLGYQPYRSSYDALVGQPQTHQSAATQQPPNRSFTEYGSGFSGGPSSALGNSDWIKRLDPRQQHHGPPSNTPDHFSRGPPPHTPQYGGASGPHQGPSMLASAQQQPVPPPPYARQHQVHPGPSANPSPPPPPQPQPGQMYRSSSAASQHARIPSHGHTQSSLHTQSPIGPPSSGYPNSATGPPLQRQPSAGGYDPLRPPSQPQHPVYDQRQHQQQPQHLQQQPPRPSSTSVYGPPPPQQPGRQQQQQQQQQPPGPIQGPPPGSIYTHHQQQQQHGHHRHYSHEGDRR